jgi:hypothetical protein
MRGGCSKLRAPHQGTSFGPFVCEANEHYERAWNRAKNWAPIISRLPRCSLARGFSRCVLVPVVVMALEKNVVLGVLADSG